MNSSKKNYTIIDDKYYLINNIYKNLMVNKLIFKLFKDKIKKLIKPYLYLY